MSTNHDPDHSTRLTATIPNDQELERMIPSARGPGWTFRGWLPEGRTPIAILVNVLTSKTLYVDEVGHQYRFRPGFHGGGHLERASARTGDHDRSPDHQGRASRGRHDFVGTGNQR